MDGVLRSTYGQFCDGGWNVKMLGQLKNQLAIIQFIQIAAAHFCS